MLVSPAESKRHDAMNLEYPEDRVFDVNGFTSGARLFRLLLNPLLRVPEMQALIIQTPGLWTLLVNVGEPGLNKLG